MIVSWVYPKRIANITVSPPPPITPALQIYQRRMRFRGTLVASYSEGLRMCGQTCKLVSQVVEFQAETRALDSWTRLLKW